MIAWWRRWWSKAPERVVQPTSGDMDLERFFTDCEQARTRFDNVLTSERLPKSVVVVHGPGAVGKSSLLCMFRLAAHRRQLPVGLVAGEEASSVVDLLAGWARDLAGDGVPVGDFEEKLNRYRTLQRKVDDEARKLGSAQTNATHDLAVAVSKGAVKVASSAVPIAGPLLEVAGGEAVDAAANLLRAVLSRQDLAFFLDPTGTLTDAMLRDLSDRATRQRLVLMLDTVESVSVLSPWLCDFVQRLPTDVLFVVAGRNLPEWDTVWPGWVGRSMLIELTEMSDEDIASLVRQYYELFGRGPAADDEVDNVVQFARGLPLAATTAVRLWVNYQVGDLKPIGPGAVADMADRLIQDVSAELRPAFEAAAVLRYFNVDSLGALLGAEATSVFTELRRWPFTRARENGFAVHDSLREVMTDAMRARSPARFRELNERAAAHYSKVLQQSGRAEGERLRLEWLYHLTRNNEPAGMKRARELAESLLRLQQVAAFRALVSDANTWPLKDAGALLCRRYYGARLRQLAGTSTGAEADLREVAASDDADPTLKAYAWCDLGAIFAQLERLAEPDGQNRALDAVRRSLALRPDLDTKLATNHVTLMNISNARADWAESIEHLNDLRQYAARVSDAQGLVQADLQLATIQALQGDFRACLQTRDRYLGAIRDLGDPPALRMQARYFTWPLVFAGRLGEAQESAEEAYRLAAQLEERELLITILESIALACGLQGDGVQAAERFAEAMNFYDNVYRGEGTDDPTKGERYIRATLSFRGLVAMRSGRLEEAANDIRAALRIKQAIGDHIGTPELHCWLGQIAELNGDPDGARAAYSQVLDLAALHRYYFQALAHAGLGRLAVEEDAGAAAHLDAAQDSGERYGYADVLAQVAVARGHASWSGADRDVTVLHYQAAMSHALQHNRYLLDDIVGDRPAGSPLLPVTAACRARGVAGRDVLTRLHAWWHSASLPGSEPPTSLTDAERTARLREPGTGGPQSTVIEQLGAALEVRDGDG